MEKTILVMHANEDKRSLADVDQLFKQLAYGDYRGQVRFSVVSATPGRALAEEIEHAFLTLALLTPQFVGSPWIQSIFAAHRLSEQSGSRLIPIHLKPIHWPYQDHTLVWVPRDKAISRYSDKDEAWYVVGNEIRRVLHTLYPGGIP